MFRSNPRVDASRHAGWAVAISLAITSASGAVSPTRARADTRPAAVGGPSAPRTSQPETAEATNPESVPAAASSFVVTPPRLVDVVRANLEPSYLVYPLIHAGAKLLVFEVDVAPHFLVHRPSWPVAFTLTPKIVLRMFNQHSAPVKTPSYMPQFSAFFWFTQELSDRPTLYTSLTISHHSNGQAGPFFLPDGSINRETGSFSTNFAELALYLVAMGQNAFAWNSLRFEWHPQFAQDRDLHGRYGSERLHLSSTLFSNLAWHGKLSVDLSAILDDFQRASSHGLQSTAERFPFGVRYIFEIPGIDLGVYVSYYVGHDYYNIYFDRVVNMLQIGLAGDTSPSLIH